MAPTLMRLLGAFSPKTLAGTIVGKPTLATAVADNLRKLLRDVSLAMATP
jgi:hypothetical protein